jgi:hypothetical protein
VRAWHPAGLWLILVLFGWELGWGMGQVGLGSPTWRNIAWAFGPGLVLTLSWCYGKRIVWPVRRHFDTYAVRGLAAPALYLYLWAVAASRLNGAPAPLPPRAAPDPGSRRSAQRQETGRRMLKQSVLRRAGPSIGPPGGE